MLGGVRLCNLPGLYHRHGGSVLEELSVAAIALYYIECGFPSNTSYTSYGSFSIPAHDFFVCREFSSACKIFSLTSSASVAPLQRAPLLSRRLASRLLQMLLYYRKRCGPSPLAAKLALPTRRLHVGSLLEQITPYLQFNVGLSMWS